MLQLDKTIKGCLKIAGRQMSVEYENGEEVSFFAVAEQTWKKNKTKFEEKASKIGRVYNEYVAIICPYDIDLTALTKNDVVKIDGENFEIERSECVKSGGKVQFYRGIVKKLTEVDENVFN